MKNKAKSENYCRKQETVSLSQKDYDNNYRTWFESQKRDQDEARAIELTLSSSNGYRFDSSAFTHGLYPPWRM